jgi:hypothetical protein
MAQENGQRLRFFFCAQLNDDLHGATLADVRSWRNATIVNGLSVVAVLVVSYSGCFSCGPTFPGKPWNEFAQR